MESKRRGDWRRGSVSLHTRAVPIRALFVLGPLAKRGIVKCSQLCCLYV